jgi:thiol-disulfide isomerase/thioredoxin
MKKTTLFRTLRIFLFLALAPILYFFWEWGASDSVLQTVRPAQEARAIRVGTPAPQIFLSADFVWAKKNFELQSFKGYPVFLHFWATWCGPCLQELPEIIELAKKRRLEGMNFVAVAVNDRWDNIETFFQQHPNLAPMKDFMVVVIDPHSNLAKSYGSSRFPETFLINDQMVIDNKFVGAQPWSDPAMGRYLDVLKTKQ